MKQSIGKKERLPQLDIFRALAILGVIQVHATSNAVAEQALNSSIYYFYNWWNIFSKVGTTSFIFLSAFVLFYNYFDKPINRELITRFYKKRLTFIILPYILVSCCYFTLLAWQRGDFVNNSKMYELQSFGMKLLTGTAYTHLYFVFISIQFYILFPLILWIFQKLRNKTTWLAMMIPIGIGLQLGFYFLNKYQLHIVNKGSYAPSYIGYYLLGAVIAVFFDKIKAWLHTDWKDMTTQLKTWTVSIWGTWLVAGFIHVQLWYTFRLGISRPNTLWFEIFWELQTLSVAIILLRLAFIIYRKGSAFWLKTLTRLGELSFGIYLFHPVVLMYYRIFTGGNRMSGDTPIYFIYILGGVVVTLLVSWIFVQSCFKWLPFSTWFLGNKPSSLHKSVKVRKDSGKRSVNTNM
ncbi:Acyltransferase family protein [compost metagenome]